MENIIEWNELLITLREYSLRIPRGCEVLAENLRNKDLVAAQKDLVNLLQGLEWMDKVNNYSKEVGQLLPLNIEAIMETLTEINIALENNEYEDAADILEYEFVEHFNSVGEKINFL